MKQLLFGLVRWEVRYKDRQEGREGCRVWTCEGKLAFQTCEPQGSLEGPIELRLGLIQT